MSKPLPISIGTFQGTCLGPLMHNSATNDLTCFVPKDIDGFRITVVRYADDCQVGITGPRSRLPALKRALEKVLDIMSTWFLEHSMKINASKTELLLCGDRRQLALISEPPEILFMGKMLKSTDRVKNLGVVMDANLSWNLHVKYVTDRCFGTLIGLLHARHLLPRNVLPRIIDSLVFSHLRYCIQVYGGTSAEMLDKIQKVFNFAARVISHRRKFDHISGVIRDLGWLDSAQFVQYSDLCLLYKLLTNREPSILASKFRFNRNVCTRTTRQSDQLFLEKPRTNHGKRTFTYRAGDLFNRNFDHVSNWNLLTYSLFKKCAKTAVRSE